MNYSMKKRNIYFSILLAFFAVITFFFVSCKGNLKEDVVKSPDGKIEKVTQYKMIGDQKDVVKETRYYSNGNKQIEGGYKNGQRDGHWLYWFENGNMQSDGYFTSGVRTGEAKVWDESGKQIYTGFYKKGKPDGIWYIYNKKGEKESEIIYKDGAILKQNRLK